MVQKVFLAYCEAPETFFEGIFLQLGLVHGSLTLEPLLSAWGAVAPKDTNLLTDLGGGGDTYFNFEFKEIILKFNFPYVMFYTYTKN